MMLLYSLIAVYANQRMPYKLLSTWVCIMLTVRMVIAPAGRYMPVSSLPA
ncbi:hypothetical protein [Prevotella sp.]